MTIRTALIALLAGLAVPASAEVPISIAESGHAVVPVTGPFGARNFVFDTGAEGSAIYDGFREELGLALAGSLRLTGQTGSAEVPLVRLPPICLDGRSSDSIHAVVLPPRADGVLLPGIVGLDLFGSFLVDFDLPRKRLALLESGSVPGGVGDPLAATPTVGNLLTVRVRIGSVEAPAVIDTGARKTRINWQLGRLLGISEQSTKAGEVIQGATNRPIETVSATLRNVRLGNRLLAEAPVLVADLPVFEAFGVADRPAIILGLDWLGETRLIVDFPARRVWFVESS